MEWLSYVPFYISAHFEVSNFKQLPHVNVIKFLFVFLRHYEDDFEPDDDDQGQGHDDLTNSLERPTDPIKRTVITNSGKQARTIEDDIYDFSKSTTYWVLVVSEKQIKCIVDDNLGIIFIAEAILMSTHNICFYGQIWKIILQLSSNTHFTCFMLISVWFSDGCRNEKESQNAVQPVLKFEVREVTLRVPARLCLVCQFEERKV